MTKCRTAYALQTAVDLLNKMGLDLKLGLGKGKGTTVKFGTCYRASQMRQIQDQKRFYSLSQC